MMAGRGGRAFKRSNGSRLQWIVRHRAATSARWDFSPVAYGPIQAGGGRCGVRGGATYLENCGEGGLVLTERFVALPGRIVRPGKILRQLLSQDWSGREWKWSGLGGMTATIKRLSQLPLHAGGVVSIANCGSCITDCAEWGSASHSLAASERLRAAALLGAPPAQGAMQPLRPRNVGPAADEVFP